MDKRIQCPICGKEGVLQWKETITKAKGKTYRYKKLYVYHWNPKKPKWCYLRKEHLDTLGISRNSLTQKRDHLTQNYTQTNTDSKKPKSSSFLRNVVEKEGPWSSQDRTLACGAEDPGFKSPRARHFLGADTLINNRSDRFIHVQE